MNTLPDRKEIEATASAKRPKTQPRNAVYSTLDIVTRAICTAANSGRKSVMIPLHFSQQANDPTPGNLCNLTLELRESGYSFDVIQEHNTDSGYIISKIRVYILPRDY